MEAEKTASHHTEPHVRDAIFSLLGGEGCHVRPASRLCRAIDLGANNGWFSLMMLQLGASVLSVEPQPDLARALRESAELNCWSGRSKVVNAFACAQGDADCQRLRVDARSCEIGGWRIGNMYGSSQLTARYRGEPGRSQQCATDVGLPESISSLNLSSLVFEHARPSSAPGGPSEIEFIKMDADGPEGSWLREFDELITGGKLRISALVVEGSNLSPTVMQRFQMVHGYSIFRLDVQDGRRHMTPEGWDLWSPTGTIARLDRYASEHATTDKLISKYSTSKAERYKASTTPGVALKPAGDGVTRMQLEEEMFAVRNMRHVYRMKANMTLQGWVTVLNPVMPRGWPPQWAFALDPVLEPMRQYAFGSQAVPERVHARKDAIRDREAAHRAQAGRHDHT